MFFVFPFKKKNHDFEKNFFFFFSPKFILQRIFLNFFNIILLQNSKLITV